MRKGFCNKCYKKQRETCTRPCEIVEAELRQKKVRAFNEEGRVMSGENEIDIVFMHEIDLEMQWVKNNIQDNEN